MKTIALTRGKVAIVDDEDFDMLSQLNWCYATAGYAFTNIGGRKNRSMVYMHRLLMQEPDDIVDHINRDKLDNRRTNLRIVNKSINGLNAGPQSNNTSGYRGVDFDRRRGKWCARLKVNGKQHNLGRFDSRDAAIQARAVAETMLIPTTATIGAHTFYR